MPRTSSTWSCTALHATLRIMSQNSHTDPPNSSAWSASETNGSGTLTCPSSPKTLTKCTSSQSTHISNDTIHIIINRLTNYAIVLHFRPVSLLPKLFFTTIVAAADEFRLINALVLSCVNLQDHQQRDPCCGELLRENSG